MSDSEFKKSEVVMKREFDVKDVKDNWMTKILAEINQLKSMALSL